MPSTLPERETLRSLLREAQYALAEGPHAERAGLDAEALLLHALRGIDEDRNRAWLIAHGDDPVPPDLETQLKTLVERRLIGEPMQYITGETEFYGLPFKVTRDVLVPRRETEHLVEWVFTQAKPFERPRIVDVGTGSGAIAVTLAHHVRNAELTATDLSGAALAIAHENAMRNGVADRVRFLEGDLLAPVSSEQFDIVVSNPPYVPNTDRALIAVEVREYEPSLALFAGEDGMDVYRRLIPAAFAVLVTGGWLALEIGFSQAAEIERLLGRAGFTNAEFLPDLQGIPRVASARRP
jgi:release factor glutamine methyltransferase